MLHCSSSDCIIDSLTFSNGSSAIPSLYCVKLNSNITGTLSELIPAKVNAFTGNGKSSTIQISFSLSLYHPRTMESNVPLGRVIDSTLLGIKYDSNPPPTGPKEPHDALLNS